MREATLAWSLLLFAGLLEACWAVGLKLTDGFRRPVASLLVALAIAASMVLLGLAARSLPIGTAYAVWVGIGALGAAVGGALVFGERLTPARLFFLGLLLVSIVGLKATVADGDGSAGTGGHSGGPGADRSAAARLPGSETL